MRGLTGRNFGCSFLGFGVDEPIASNNSASRTLATGSY